MSQGISKRAEILIIPQSMYKSLHNSNFNIMDIVDYTKLRSHIVINDIATMVAMNRELKINGKLISTVYPTLLFNTMSKEETIEFNVSVLPLSLSASIVDSMNTALSLTNVDANSMADGFYSFIQTEDHIFLVLRDGFLSRLTDSSYRLEFVKTYLKHCYSVTDIASVSTNPMFSAYINELFQPNS